jgi:hypothetical protein
MYEAAHVLPPDQWDVFAELLPEQLDQATPVARLFLSHSIEDGGRRRKRLPQALAVFGINTLIFFLERDRQRQDLAFGQAIKAPHAFNYD